MSKICKSVVIATLCAGFIFCTIFQIPLQVKAQTDEEWEKETISCKITGWDTVEFRVRFDILPVSDDNMFYLYEMNTYEYELLSSSPLVTSQKMSQKAVFSFTLNAQTASTRLYKKFVVAVKQNGVMQMVTEPQYITNPEYLATSTRKRPKTTSKKGLLLDTADGKELGVQHYITNMYVDTGLCMSNIMDEDGVKNVVVLNKWNKNQNWINPLSRDNKKANYYMFNAADAPGVELLSKAMQSYAAVFPYDNWIIGNEINARNPWNYMKQVPLEEYTREYVQAFRVMYTAIKSRNANAEVFISLDQNWDMNQTQNPNLYDAKDLLDCFNTMILQGGNIDYDIAFHPYPTPLSWAKVWDMSSVDASYANMVRDTMDSPVVSFQNLHVLTDYLKQPLYLNPQGKRRTVVLSEIGLNSAQGEEIQAAAMVYAYIAAESDDMVESIIFSRGIDMKEELRDNMAFGLTYPDGRHKYAYNVFKYMDTKSGEQCMEFAKDVIGIDEWSQVLLNADRK